VQVSVDLPLLPGTRQQPKLAAKLSERAALDADHDSALQEHIAMLESALAEHQRLTDTLNRTHKVLLPLAKEKVELTLSAWRNNKAELSALIAARKERIDTELKAIQLEGERQQLAARLHYTYSQQTLHDSEIQP